MRLCPISQRGKINVVGDRHNWAISNSPKEVEEPSQAIGSIGFANLPKGGKNRGGG